MAKKPDNSESLPYREALGLINKPEASIKGKQGYDRIACVFQGGGALGAFQVGAFRAIHERGYNPDYLAGVSIGAINSAIIAGNPREKQLEKLMGFWNKIVPDLWSDALTEFQSLDFVHHLHNRVSSLSAVFQGVEGFFRPRIFPTALLNSGSPDLLSYYDTSPLKKTLEAFIDFDLINQKKVTLCLGAVDVASGEMIYFNNQKIRITPEHVMASGALPPGFPAIKIGERYYWDGGIYANTPLVAVLDALPEKDTLCFVVDCFSLKGNLPTTMDQVEERQKDIRYASHSRRMTNIYASRNNLQSAIEYLGSKLTPEAKKDPEVKKILRLGHKKRFNVVHIIYSGTAYSHSYKDYNFSHYVIDLRLKEGYETASKILDKPSWQNPSKKIMGCSIYGVSSDYYDQH